MNILLKVAGAADNVFGPDEKLVIGMMSPDGNYRSTSILKRKGSHFPHLYSLVPGGQILRLTPRSRISLGGPLGGHGHIVEPYPYAEGVLLGPY